MENKNKTFNSEKGQILRTLLGSGFSFKSSYSRGNLVNFVQTSRVEQLGISIKYLLAFTSSQVNENDIKSFKKEAFKKESNLVVIVNNLTTSNQDVTFLTYEQFYDRLGGPIMSLLPFNPEYSNCLLKLGHNTNPPNIQGKPDELFEEYAHAGLQFLFRGRVIKYGQDRLFEKVTDGIIFSQNAPLILYDAKASKDGYSMSSTSIRQFTDYVDEFHNRYSKSIGFITTFLVISGSFTDSKNVLKNRSRELLSNCRTPLSFLDCKEFGEIIKLLISKPMFRPVVDWKYIFSNELINSKEVIENIKAREKDKILENKGA